MEKFLFYFSSVYELPFYDTKIPRGFYTIHLTLTPRIDGKFIGLTDNTVRFSHSILLKLENNLNFRLKSN